MLDEFKYQVYRAKLESIKGTKAPIKRIITELFDIHPYLCTGSQTITESNLYAFRLINMAVNYSSAKQVLTKDQLSTYRTSCQNLLMNSTVTVDTIHTIFEFPIKLISYLNINFSTIQQLFNFIEAYEVLELPSINVQYYNIVHFRSISNWSSHTVAAYLVHNNFPNSKFYNDYLKLYYPNQLSIADILTQINTIKSQFDYFIPKEPI